METRIGYKRCAVCGAEYKLGPNCNRLSEAGVMSWKHTTDTPKCFQIFCVLKDYVDKVVPLEESRSAIVGLLDGVDYSEYDETSKLIIDEIMSAALPAKSKSKNLK